ncbi:MAG: molybdenum cofactor biosynthesis F family protein [Deltaproteobacteria bacterium]|nr:molybdenum cofactor biosynthesis F family protein [Deltaproteobacteria bacterium]
MDKPSDWKDYDDFAAGIDTNRLPATDELIGKTFTITLSSGAGLELDFKEEHRLDWADGTSSDSDWYEAINVGQDVYFIDMTFDNRPRDSRTLIVNTQTRRVLSILSHVREEKIEGEPLVTQTFETGVLGDATVDPQGPEPAPTRDLIGLRAFYRYSPNHLYEHIYLSAERYAWQCLVGEQRGHGDVDLATTYKFDEGQYLFTFREFIIPVASVFFYNWDQMRSTGKFLGITGDGKIQNNPAGAFIRNASMTFYDKEWAPV